MAATVTRAPFGRLPDGGLVEALTLEAGRVRVRILTLGATLQSILVPDRRGAVEDVLLGHDDITGYLARPDYFGATVGRYANRIAGGRFTLDGVLVELARNDGENTLHGGPTGFDRRLWSVEGVGDDSGEGRDADPGGVGRAVAVLSLDSPDGDQGFPGHVKARARFSLTPAGELSILYEARTDRPTVINLTNHAYFNLAGQGAPGGGLDALLEVPADHFLPVNAALIPTGALQSVAGGPFDFRTPKPPARDVRDGAEPQLVLARGYDHCFVLGRAPTPEARPVARLTHEASGRRLEILSNQPGLQVYSGNFLDGTLAGKSGRLYRQGDALALEPQLFPDTPNQPAFGSARLAPGETYRHEIIYRFSAPT